MGATKGGGAAYPPELTGEDHKAIAAEEPDGEISIERGRYKYS